MKKQIFILIVAVFAATTSFGQMVHNSAPIPLACTTDATHPLAGVPYNYKVLVAPAGNFQWWATTDVDFIKTTAGVTTNNSGSKLAVGAALPLLAAGLNYGTAASATDNVDITWSSAALVTALTTPTFVVVQADATGTNCSNNLKVYKITPVNGFTVDIKNMSQAKVPLALYTDPLSVCVANIESAKYDVATSAIVTNYGTNVLYYEVVASNFTGGYTPYFQVTGLAAGQTVTSIDLSVAPTFATTIATTLTAGAYNPAAPLTVDPSVTNTSTGVSIYVRLTIANGTHEHLADAPITLAVNGTNTALQKDVVNSACATQTDYEDSAVQTITKRPTVTSSTTGGAFVTP
jgi:hypothetical protein